MEEARRESNEELASEAKYHVVDIEIPQTDWESLCIATKEGRLSFECMVK